MSTLNSSLSRAKYVVWLWLFGISSFRIKGVFVLLRFATVWRGGVVVVIVVVKYQTVRCLVSSSRDTSCQSAWVDGSTWDSPTLQVRSTWCRMGDT